MDNKQLNRLSEKDRLDLQNKFQKASDNGKGILNMLLCCLISVHDCKYQAQKLEPPSRIDNYKIDTSPYSPEVDKEFAGILRRISENQTEVKNQYNISSPEEKVLLRQAVALTVEMLKQALKSLIQELMESTPTEEIEQLIFYSPIKNTIPYRLSSEELKELIEQIQLEQQSPFEKKEVVEEKKTEERTMKYQERPIQSIQTYTYEEPKRVDQWNSNVTIIKESQDRPIQSVQSYTISDSKSNLI